MVVVEGAAAAGGWMHEFDLIRHHFDTGVHYVGQLQPGGPQRRLAEIR